MKGKIKIRTMKDDLADADVKRKKPIETKQDQNKSNIAAAKMPDFGAAPDKFKDKEIDELKNLIEKISESEEKHVEKEGSTIRATNEEEKQVDLKSDQENDLKELVNKISETISKESDAVKAENKDDELGEIKEMETKEAEENKQSFWNNISEKLKNSKVTESQKINDIRKKDELMKKSVEGVKKGKDNDSGILTNKKLPEIKKEPEEKEEIRKKFYGDDNYQPPENRLIFGKQKKYSSVSKRIKLKDKKDEIEDLKNANEIKEKQKIISEKEKYKRLKSRVIKKYNVRLFLLPWKKIISIAVILIVLSGAAYYILVKKLVPSLPNPPAVVIGTEIEKFTRIKNSVEFTKKDIAKMSLKEVVINEKFKTNNEIEELRIIIKDNGRIISLKEALTSMKIEIKDFPNDFWNTTTESYNIFVLKTNADDFRFAIAIESNDVASLLKTMRDWERETVDKKKMFNVFEPFFTNSETEEDFYQKFEAANYKYTYVRYINLPDKNTSFDYFANDNSLVITTSKKNANRIIDILSDNYDYDYDYDYLLTLK